MKEIKENFKNENYECTLTINEKSVDVGLSGMDDNNEFVMDYHSFDDIIELLDYLERNENSNTNKISVFYDDIKIWFMSRNCFTKIPA